MSELKWFSGGKERGDQAIIIITDLLSELNNDPKNQALQKVLSNYQDELTRKEAAVPLILSRMNLDISSAMRKDEVLLSDAQSNKLKELTSLSNIKYG